MDEIERKDALYDGGVQHGRAYKNVCSLLSTCIDAFGVVLLHMAMRLSCWDSFLERPVSCVTAAEWMLGTDQDSCKYGNDSRLVRSISMQTFVG